MGPGLLESAYQKCLANELQRRGLKVECEIEMPLTYNGMRVDLGYRLDMLVEGCVIIENKAVTALLPLHEAQLLIYMRLSNCHLGYLINWNVVLVKDGIKRMVLKL